MPIRSSSATACCSSLTLNGSRIGHGSPPRLCQLGDGRPGSRQAPGPAAGAPPNFDIVSSKRRARIAGDAVRDALRSGGSAGRRSFDVEAPRPLLREPVVLDHVTSDMAVTRSDLFAPVLSFLRVSSEDEALRENERCPYALSATVFGSTVAAGRWRSESPPAASS